MAFVGITEQINKISVTSNAIVRRISFVSIILSNYFYASIIESEDYKEEAGDAIPIQLCTRQGLECLDPLGDRKSNQYQN